MSYLGCPNCGRFAVLETQQCERCGVTLGYHWPSQSFRALDRDDDGDGRPDGVDIDGTVWDRCINWDWACNWLAPTDGGSGRCFACRLVRRRPEVGDSIALEMLAAAGLAERRLIAQLFALGLPVTPFHEVDGGLGFDLILGDRANRVMIGHADGIITIDLAETADDRREALRISLGEPYRTMLGHFRHEVGHYYQWVLASDEPWLGECRALFGDEQASYSDAIERHYRYGSPDDWSTSFISEYATMHPWEDFAETFAHYLHITATLATASMSALELCAERSRGLIDHDIVPRVSYADATIDELLEHWRWFSLVFNRINRTMGHRDLYPFTITGPVADKLGFVHRLVTQRA